jgi:iron complex outermembrane receptor protein
MISKQFLGAIVSALLLCMMTGPAMAQEKEKKSEKDYSAFELGEVVVMGETSGVRDVSIVSTVTAEQIEQTHSLNVPQALSYVPGITVTTGGKNNPTIRLHGLNQSEIAVLIDGVPYYEPNFGTLNLNQLPTDMIARIDVIKGAPSVLYGTNAMGGVINIITKKSVDRPTFSGLAEVGNYGNYHVSASHGNSVGKFNYWLNLSRKYIRGWRMSDDFEPQEGTVREVPGGTRSAVLEDGGQRDNSDTTQTNIWAKVGVELGPESQYYASAFLIDSEWGCPAAINSAKVDYREPAYSSFRRFSPYEDWGVDLSGVQRLNDLIKLRGKLFYHNHVDTLESYSDMQYNNMISSSRWHDYVLGGTLIADLDLHPQDVLHFSLHYSRDSHSRRDDAYLPYADSYAYTGSAGVENEWTPLNNLVVVAGVSYDWFQVDQAETLVTDDDGNYVRTQREKTPDLMDS